MIFYFYFNWIHVSVTETQNHSQWFKFLSLKCLMIFFITILSTESLTWFLISFLPRINLFLKYKIFFYEKCEHGNDASLWETPTDNFASTVKMLIISEHNGILNLHSHRLWGSKLLFCLWTFFNDVLTKNTAIFKQNTTRNHYRISKMIRVKPKKSIYTFYKIYDDRPLWVSSIIRLKVVKTLPKLPVSWFVRTSYGDVKAWISII